MKKLVTPVLLLLGIVSCQQSDAIRQRSPGKDIVFEAADSLGNMVEVARMGAPQGDIARSVGTVGSVANSQGALGAADFTTPTTAHWYSLTDLVDSTTGTALPLTNNGTTLFNQVGFFGRESAVQFLGAQNLSSTSSVFNVGNTNFSYGGWFKIQPSTSASQILIGNFDVTGYFIRYNGTSQIIDFYLGGVSAFSVPAGPFNDLAWHHFAVSYSSTGPVNTFYVDGKKAGTASTTNVAPGTFFRIGAAFSGAGQFLTGAAQDAFFALETLSDSQINAIYSHRFTNTAQVAAGHVLAASSFPLASLSGKATFYNLASVNDGSVNAKNLTDEGTTPYTGLDIFGAETCAKFNGTTQSLKSTDAFFNLSEKTFSFGGWFAADGWLGNAGSRQFLIGITDGTTEKLGLVNQASGNITLDCDSSSSQAVMTAPNFEAGSWHHVAGVVDNGVCKLYVDGVLVATQTQATATLASPVFRISGKGTTLGNPFIGRADEVFFVKDVVLSPSDIKKIYSSKISHSKNISPANQNWFSSWMREDSKLALPLENGWISDMSANDLFLDFSSLSPGDYVTVKMK